MYTLYSIDMWQTGENLSLLSQRTYAEQLSDPQLSLGDLFMKIEPKSYDPEMRLAFIENTSLDDFLLRTDLIHQKVAPGPEQAFATDTVYMYRVYHKDATLPEPSIKHYPTANPAERIAIMSYALEKQKDIAQKFRTEGGSIEDALVRCGNLSAFGITLAHFYEDGSGRTARSEGQFIRNGYHPWRGDLVADLQKLSQPRTDQLRQRTYAPKGKWSEGGADRNPLSFLNAVASLAIPLDGISYTAATRHTFLTPYR